MYVSAIHDISDPEKFWATAHSGGEMPAGVKLHHTFANPDGTRAVCLWEADSLDTVATLLDEFVGAYSRNEFYEVNPQTAVGLPG